MGAAEAQPEFPRSGADPGRRHAGLLREEDRVRAAQLLAAVGRPANGRDRRGREAAPAHGCVHPVDLTIGDNLKQTFLDSCFQKCETFFFRYVGKFTRFFQMIFLISPKSKTLIMVFRIRENIWCTDR